MKFTRQQWQWIFYDWANSGYGILVVTAVLPVYFKAVADHAGVSAANSTALWDTQIVLVRLLFHYLHLYWEHWLIIRMQKNAG